MFRVSDMSRGPLDPPLRPNIPATDRVGWSRFDVPRYAPSEGAPFEADGRTIYGTARRDTAFTEVLAWKMAMSQTYAGIVESARFTGEPVHVVLQEMHAKGIDVAAVDPSWRARRGVYNVSIGSGLWVDLTHRDSIAAARVAVGREIGDVPFTRAELAGDDRTLTTRVAEALRCAEVEYPGGGIGRPEGIRFESKFGVVSTEDFCWAIWGADRLRNARTVWEGDMRPEDTDVQTAVRITGVYVP